MATGNYNKVPLDEAITEAKVMLRISETTVHDNDLAIFAQRALIRLGNLKQFEVENEVLDVVDGEVVLPEHLIRILALRYCNDENESYGITYADFSFMNQCGCTLTGESELLGNVVMINNGVLAWKYPANAPTKIRMAYTKRITDSDGFIAIYDYMVDAVKFYICWNFATMFIDKYPQWQIWKKEWKAQHDRVISIDAFNSFQDNFGKVVRASHPVIISI